MGGESFPGRAGCRRAACEEIAQSPATPVTSPHFAARACCVRFMAARPPTFFVLPKKVGKERRAHEDGGFAAPLRCSVRTAAAGTRTISRLRREPGASNSRRPNSRPDTALLGVFEGISIRNDELCLTLCVADKRRVRRTGTKHPLSRQGGRGSGRGWVFRDAFKDAEQRRTRRGSRASTVRSTWLVAQRRDRASFDARRLVRVAQGTAAGGVFVGAPSFGYFSWQDKKSDWPRGHEAHTASSRSEMRRSERRRR